MPPTELRMNLVALALLSMLVVMASSHRPHYDVANANSLFEDFIKEHNRKYKDDADKELHFKVFVENLEKINKMNEQSPSATYGINKFADKTNEEKKNMFGLKRPDTKKE